jgi:hypothetical protein
MLRKFTVVSLAVSILTASGAALAQTPERQASQGSVDYRFADELVTTRLMAPEGTHSRARIRHAGPSLLRIRQNFVQEMTRSVEKL